MADELDGSVVRALPSLSPARAKLKGLWDRQRKTTAAATGFSGDGNGGRQRRQARMAVPADRLERQH